MPELRLSLLGPFALDLDGNPVSGITSPRLHALLAYLALEAEQPHTRESLAELIWPDRPPGAAGQSLRQSLSRLGKVLPPGASPLILADRHTVQFNRAGPHWVDAIALIEQIEATRGHAHRQIEHCRRCAGRLATAASLYRGELLQGVVADSPLFDQWVMLKREWVRREALSALEVLAEHWLWLGDYRQAYRFAWRLVELYAWREAGHRHVMRALAGMGRRSEALAQYESLRVILRRELGVDPARESTELYEQIKSGRLPSRDHAATDKRLPAVRGLPAVHTPFVGRAEVLAEISERLDHASCHLLTLIGPGGAGKSRLAIRTAREKADEYPHGAVFVSLAGPASGHDLLAALSVGLGVPGLPSEETEEVTRARLMAHLRGRELLLILDNYEPLLPDTALVREILDQAPLIKLLVTSRQPLDLHAEWIVEINGMSYPSQPGSQDVAGYEAVQLFSQNVARLGGRFRLMEANSPAVVRICRLVAGLPLALELAAAWARTRSPERIADQIEKNLDFLATSQLDADPRHRSLQAVFEGSWKLLSAGQREVFSGLSRFQGGFSAQAAAWVLHVGPPELAALIEKSLLRRDERQRYDIYEVLRQYAGEKLAADTAAADRVADRHAEYYTNLLGDQREALLGPQAQAAAALVQVDFDNVRRAWRRAAERQMWSALQRAWPALGRYYVLTSNLEEAVTAFELASAKARAGLAGAPECGQLLGGLLAERAGFLVGLGRYPLALEAAQEAIALTTAGAELSGRARARLAAGNAHARLGEYPAATDLLQGACDDARQAGLPHLQADSLRQLAHVAIRQGAYSDADDYYNQSLAICRALAYPLGEAYSLSGLGNVSLVRERPGEARRAYQAALKVYAVIGDQVGAMTSLDNTATTYWAEGDYGQAQAIHTQVLEIRRQIGDRRGEGATLAKLAIQRHYQGDFVGGQRYYAESLAIYREIGYRRGEGEVLAHLCLLHHHAGRDETAIELGRQAVTLARDMSDLSDLAHALNFLGHALLGHGDLEQAEAAYAESLALRHGLGEHNRAQEPLAGLAQIALARGDLPQAQAHIQDILTHLEIRDLVTTDEPARVYLACAQTLDAAGDPRLGQLVAAGCQLVRTRAGKIADEALRKSYLQAIPARRALLDMERMST